MAADNRLELVVEVAELRWAREEAEAIARGVPAQQAHELTLARRAAAAAARIKRATHIDRVSRQPLPDMPPPSEWASAGLGPSAGMPWIPSHIPESGPGSTASYALPSIGTGWRWPEMIPKPAPAGVITARGDFQYLDEQGRKHTVPSAKAQALQAAQASQAPAYSNGTAIPGLGGLPSLDRIGGGVASGAGPVMIQLDGPATTALLRGEAVLAIASNPRVVAGASMRAVQSNAGRRELTSLQLSPGLLTA